MFHFTQAPFEILFRCSFRYPHRHSVPASSRPEDEHFYPDVNNLANMNVFVSFAVKTFAEICYSEGTYSSPKISKQEATIPVLHDNHPSTRAPHKAGKLIHGTRDNQKLLHVRRKSRRKSTITADQRCLVEYVKHIQEGEDIPFS